MLNREKVVECQLCLNMVPCVHSSLRSHLHEHCSGTLFLCKLCQRGFQERIQVYEHIQSDHPSKKVVYSINNFFYNYIILFIILVMLKF